MSLIKILLKLNGDIMTALAGVYFDTNNSEKKAQEAITNAKQETVDSLLALPVLQMEEHKHLTREYDEGCQRRDYRNDFRKELIEAIKEWGK